jgi:hypothetical protein
MNFGEDFKGWEDIERMSFELSGNTTVPVKKY